MSETAKILERMVSEAGELADKLMPVIMHLCHDRPAIIVLMALQEMTTVHFIHYMEWLKKNGKEEEARLVKKIFIACLRSAVEVLKETCR